MIWVYHWGITGRKTVYVADEGTTFEQVKQSTINWVGKVFIVIKGGKSV